MPMHVKGVERTYTHFTHNFLNIQPIFNQQKVLESLGLGLFNHQMLCMLKHVEVVKGQNNLRHSNIDTI